MLISQLTELHDIEHSGKCNVGNKYYSSVQFQEVHVTSSMEH